MMSDQNMAGHASGFSRHSSPATRHRHVAALLLALACGLPAPAGEATNSPSPVNARDFYNAGTRQLAATNYAEAERMFHSALATQDERVQAPALFNLGHVRFADGAEILRKGPDAQKVSTRGQASLESGANTLRTGESALAERQLDGLISAYLASRGARRELRAAEKAVKSALETCGRTLNRWQRAADDFQGAAELNPRDTNATQNAEIVRQRIAALVDALQKLQAMAGQMAGQKQQLDKMLGKLKGLIPAPDAPPGASGEDEDEGEGSGQGDIKPEALAGKEEGAGREGEQFEAPLSPNQAGQMLDGLPVDGSKRLPMGGDKEASPMKEKTGRNW
jgi:tetratricopeptide (TPR) repeat protein